MSGTVTERIAGGELLIESTINPRVRHEPRHPGQRTGPLLSRCNRPVVLIAPDAPSLRDRPPLVMCENCASKA
jgi:hypothetical protein